MLRPISRILFLTTVFALLAFTAKASAQKYITFDVAGGGTGNWQGTFVWGTNFWGAVDGPYIDSNYTYHGYVRAPGGKVTTFDVPGAGTGAYQGTVPQGINMWGAITGQYYNGNVSHGFLRTADGTITTFDVKGAGSSGTTYTGTNNIGAWASEYQGTYPEAINDLGEIAGYYVDANWVWHGFVRAPNGKISTFDVKGAGAGPGQGTYVNYTCPATNNAGVLAGMYMDANDVRHGYIRTRDGKITTFDVPGAGTAPLEGTIPSSINLEGEVSGIMADNINWHGFVRSPDGKTTTIYDAPGNPYGTTTVGEDINYFGVAMGQVNDVNGVWHGYFRTPDGTLTVFDVPGAGTSLFQGTYAESINMEGVIVGHYWDTNFVGHGFLRLPK